MIEATRSVLSRSWAYQSFWHGIGGDRRNRALVRDYIRPLAGDRVLDIGCGPGTMAPYLPGSDYVGFDASAEYIDRAQHRFPRAHFVCQRVSHYTWPSVTIRYRSGARRPSPSRRQRSPDAFPDRSRRHEAGREADHDRRSMDRRSVSHCQVSACARSWTLCANRKCVSRNSSKGFSRIESSIRHDLLRMPYSLIILKCVR
jgi:SAM-dependent methyltransferase